MAGCNLYFGPRIMSDRVVMQWGLDGRPNWYAPMLPFAFLSGWLLPMLRSMFTVFKREYWACPWGCLRRTFLR